MEYNLLLDDYKAMVEQFQLEKTRWTASKNYLDLKVARHMDELKKERKNIGYDMSLLMLLRLANKLNDVKTIDAYQVYINEEHKITEKWIEYYQEKINAEKHKDKMAK